VERVAAAGATIELRASPILSARDGERKRRRTAIAPAAPGAPALRCGRCERRSV